MNYFSTIKATFVFGAVVGMAWSGSLFGMGSSHQILGEFKANTGIILTRSMHERRKQIFSELYNLITTLPKELITVICDYDITEWCDAKQPSCVKTIQAHKNAIWYILALKNGGFATVAHNDPMIHVWDKNGDLLKKITSKMAQINCMAQLDEEKFVVGGYTVGTNANKHKTIECRNSFADEKQRVYTGSAGEVVCMIPVSATGRDEKKEWVGHGSSDGSIELRHPATDGRTIVANSEVDGDVLALADLGNGRIISLSKNNKINVWNWKSGKTKPEKVGPSIESVDYEHVDVVYGVPYNTEVITTMHALDSSSVVFGSERGYLTKWDIKEESDQVLVYDVGGKVSSMRLLSNNLLLVVLSDGQLGIYNLKTKGYKMLSDTSILGIPSAFTVLNQPGNRLISGYVKGNCRLWT